MIFILMLQFKIQSRVFRVRADTEAAALEGAFKWGEGAYPEAPPSVYVLGCRPEMEAGDVDLAIESGS